ncbi:MAG TPA: CbiX/SirB N-terminal domain-containing protein [Pseudonocardiaceae bacterium]|jgi:sirohydrochlorin ferrochelatase|nr:CbiX/SirB N-terminal domain-containing protein [Pseudonocardiaceae bacterium]
MRAIASIDAHRRAAHSVVVAAHGTRDLAGVLVARQLVAALRLRLPGSSVRLAFIDVLGPAVREVVAGAPGPVTVVPAFLTCGYHVRTDVPREVAATGRRDVTVTAALGPHPLLVSAMADRLRVAGWRPGDAVVLAAAGSSDQRAVADVRAAAMQLSGELGCRVRVGFVATGAPSVTALVRGLRADGAPRVAVASWLLAPGLFHRRLADSEADVVAAPLGTHPGVIDRLANLVGTRAVRRSA